MPDLTTLHAQPQETPLTSEALHQLDSLRQQSSSTYQNLHKRLAKAVQHITEVSTQINDRGSAERARYNKQRSRLIAKGQNDEDEDEKREHDEFQDKVNNTTKDLDQKIRSVVDKRIWLEKIPNAMSHVITKSVITANDTRSTQATTQQSEEIDVDDVPGSNATQQTLQPNPSRAPSALLHAALSTNETSWRSKSLTERYSQDNDYVGWYRMVYDAQHPGETAPQMPHASLWFAEEENRNTTAGPRGSQRRSRSDARNSSTPAHGEDDADSESDIEIAAERIRIKCPLTLLPYKDPLASTKCPHAFEKAAILDILHHTADHLPYTPEQQFELSQITRAQERSKREKQIRTPMVRCPECSVPLTENDLRPDPVLLRKVNRILDKERRREEAEREADGDILDTDEDDENEEGEDDGRPRGTQRRNIVHLGSSPTQGFRRQSGRVVKNERQSIVPQTQLSDHFDDEVDDE